MTPSNRPYPRSARPVIYGIRADTGETIDPPYPAADLDDLDRACAAAAAAFDIYRATPDEMRADLLEAIGAEIAALGDALIERAMLETGLPRARLEGERARTIGQLGLFAGMLRQGEHQGLRIEPGLPDRQPSPRPELRLRNIPIGPVAVFGASNFPFAFSVAGGDTASALAAGCPVIVKAHSAHPGVSALVGQAVERAVAASGLPQGVFALLFDADRTIGQSLVADPRIKAVGFTGSRTGGQALMDIAARRAEPIPVFAEMSSINPVLLLPSALARRGAGIGAALVASMTLGAGQFCTSPGLLLAVEGDGLEDFIAAAAAALATAPAQTMLTPGIHAAFARQVDALAVHPQVRLLGRGEAGGPLQGQAALFECSGTDYLAHPELSEEVFGSSSLLVRCADQAQVTEILENLEGQLTASLHVDEADYPLAAALMPILERKAGRIIANGFGTGVEVSPAMVHGGPFPSTSDGRSTSVGSLAITRFLRPICYQDLPADLLPSTLRG